MIRVHLNSRYRGASIGSRFVVGVVRRALGLLKHDSVEVGITLVGDRTIRRLNARYRRVDRSTDVLAFPLEGRPGTQRSSGQPVLLGDVVISLETARRQARDLGHSVRCEVAALAIHGLLHLLGYDHERSGSAARRMRQKEKTLLEQATNGRCPAGRSLLCRASKVSSGQ